MSDQIEPPNATRAHPGTVLVAVTPQQPAVVLHTAIRLASALGADLVCAHVDQTAYVVDEHPDGTVVARPVDPDVHEWTGSHFDPAMGEQVREIADAAGVRYRLVELAGEVGRALGRLAEVIDAELVVVGSRSGVRAGIRDYLGGSVAVHLAHRQHRPVVVVPLAARADGPMPWEES